MLIAFEGADGVGKSTLARLLAEELGRIGECVYTKEPAQTVAGDEIRRRLADNKPIGVDLYHRDRMDHVRHEIMPALSDGKTVVCDRYFYTTAVYQSQTDNDMQEILATNRSFAPEPNVVVFVDCSLEQSFIRLSLKAKDRYERDVRFQAEVRRKYRLLLENAIQNRSPCFNAPVVIVDGAQPPVVSLSNILNRI